MQFWMKRIQLLLFFDPCKFFAFRRPDFLSLLVRFSPFQFFLRIGKNLKIPFSPPMHVKMRFNAFPDHTFLGISLVS